MQSPCRWSTVLNAGSIVVKTSQKRDDCRYSHNIMHLQKDFLASHIVEASPKRLRSSTGPLKHRVARGYYLPIDGAPKRVCGDFFCKTLDLNLRSVQKFMDVRKADGQVLASSVDGRGKHVPKNKTPEWQLNLIRQHINSYLVWRAIIVDKQPKVEKTVLGFIIISC